jgi:hypothetical protein
MIKEGVIVSEISYLNYENMRQKRAAVVWSQWHSSPQLIEHIRHNLRVYDTSELFRIDWGPDDLGSRGFPLVNEKEDKVGYICKQFADMTLRNLQECTLKICLYCFDLTSYKVEAYEGSGDTHSPEIAANFVIDMMAKWDSTVNEYKHLSELYQPVLDTCNHFVYIVHKDSARLILEKLSGNKLEILVDQDISLPADGAMATAKNILLQLTSDRQRFDLLNDCLNYLSACSMSYSEKKYSNIPLHEYYYTPEDMHNTELAYTNDFYVFSRLHPEIVKQFRSMVEDKTYIENLSQIEIKGLADRLLPICNSEIIKLNTELLAMGVHDLEYVKALMDCYKQLIRFVCIGQAIYKLPV